MTGEAVNARNVPDERVIDACIELLDAGRPISEILEEMRRLSEEELPRRGVDDSEVQATQQIGSPAAKGTGTEPVTQTSFVAVHAHGKSQRILPIAAVVLLSGAAAMVGSEYIPRAIPLAWNITAAPAPSATLSPMATASDDSKAGDPGQTPLNAAQIKALVDRGTVLVGSGDIAAARLYYEPAASAGDAHAALYLGETYDPYFLKRGRFGNSVRGDVKSAEHWYRRAQQLGSSKAEEMLEGSPRAARNKIQ